MPTIEISDKYCKGCSLCIVACPKEVIEIGNKVNAKGYRVAEAIHLKRCTGCKFCAISCPDRAIEVFK